ncbi:MAG TPA: tetratricopeptide repeat protein [Zeimonas sp.]|nr:tetratricopeptide repeat protein [Zeimonas sp.]
MEVPVVSGRSGRPDSERPIHVRLLGPMTVGRDGVELSLPASRKARGLFAWLALAPRAVTRDQLCELLWEAPTDPRAELRWCLSKIRSIVDGPVRPRVQARDDAVRLDLSDCFVDAVEVARASDEGLGQFGVERLRELSALFRGDFLEGLEIDRSPFFSGWLTAQRRRFRDCRAALLERLVGVAADDEAFGYLEQWLQLAPFDHHVHELLLTALARRGRIREGEEHLAAAARIFEADGLDVAPIREAWRFAREQEAAAPRIVVGAPAAIAVPVDGDEGALAVAARRASIAVMPFGDQTGAMPAGGGIADALAHDVITRLAKLRVLFVIAQGTVFALHERGIGAEEAGRLLKVDYVVGGSVRRQGSRLTVAVELSETRTSRIVWAETLSYPADDALLALDEIGNRIVASVATEIESLERSRAILKPPSSLDAWEAHHRGLWHMYRFSKVDNERARHFFETAVQRDPTFARAWAGLSFTHFQNAFQGWAERGAEIDRAFETAGQSLMVDDRDPAAHWAMGRALWLRGQHDRAVVELGQAVELSPNFALGHYTLAFVQAQDGDPDAAINSSDYSRHLSPFDPLLFAMLGSRAMALVRQGRFDEAAGWAVKAAARPNAHAHIYAIAAFSLALAGSLDDARAHAAAIRKLVPGYGVADFLAAFQFDTHGAALFREGARRVGMA